MLRLMGPGTREEKATAIRDYYVAIAKAIEDYNNIISPAWNTFNNNTNTVAARKVLEDAIAGEEFAWSEIIEKAYKVFNKTVSRDRKVYDRAVAVSLKVFNDTIAEAWREQDKVVHCLCDTYEEVMAVAESSRWNTYDTVVVPSWEECYAWVQSKYNIKELIG